MESVSGETGRGEIAVAINGDTHTLSEHLRVAEWLASTGRDPRSVAIELNGEILPRHRYPETVLVDGDRLEMVQFVQGG